MYRYSKNRRKCFISHFAKSIEEKHHFSSNLPPMIILSISQYQYTKFYMWYYTKLEYKLINDINNSRNK